MDGDQERNLAPAQTTGFYRPDETVSASADTAPATNEPAITWTASEFIAQHKSTGWYLALTAVATIIAAIVFLVTKDLISTIVIILAAVVLGIYGARQPRQLQYSLDASGLQIGERFIPLHMFRSFAIVDEGALDSIIFMPIKRFGQAITIYFDPNDEDRIVNLLANQLPMENKTHDMIDRLMRRIRF